MLGFILRFTFRSIRKYSFYHLITVTGLIIVLNRDFLIMVIMALAIGIPVTYLLARSWLTASRNPAKSLRYE